MLNVLRKLPKLGNGFWSTSDQGSVSLGNFLSNLILAKHLQPAEYGCFGLLFGFLLVANSFHSSFVTLPLSVYGANADSDERKRLTGNALVFNLVLAVPMSLACVGPCLVLNRVALSPLVALAMFLWFVQETGRRALMAQLRYRDAILGDAISYLGQAVIFGILARRGALNIPVALIVMSATSAIAALLQIWQTGALIPASNELPAVAKRFYSFGIWPLLGNLANVLTIQIFPWTLALVRGPAQVAVYQAAANVLAVSHPLLLSIGNLIVPASARAMAAHGIAAARLVSIRYGAQGALLLGPYYAALLFFPRPALRLLYGVSSPYLTLGFAVRSLVIAYSFAYLSQVMGSLFSGIARNKFVFIASLAGVAVSLVVAIPMIVMIGITGALIASCFVGGARCLVCLYYYQRAA